LGFRIARTAGDRFGMLLATGLPLPFLSYGRSNLVISMVAAGTLISIGRSRGRLR
ncbi:MAG: FtsW/RodA/SpoVE family cell cycle protein, partial [Gemmatimonadetes bacterium]|nr:FtsW/RodA/SpoVE family cell cycle protein [Gemmatimonadota bacterium]